MMVFKPAASVRVQDKLDWESATGEPLQVALATPERLSLAVPAIAICGFVTVAPETGDAIANAGGVLSIFSVTDAVAVPSPAAVTVPDAT